MVETSVIVPAYNAAEYLEKCVSSVLQQTRENLEVIVVNDGSTDRTPELCEQLRNKDSRVRVIHKENGGLSSARNLGLEVATGEYVFFLDADDWLSEACLADLHALREKTNADIVIANFVSFDEEKGYLPFTQRMKRIMKRLTHRRSCLRVRMTLATTSRRPSFMHGINCIVGSCSGTSGIRKACWQRMIIRHGSCIFLVTKLPT